MNPPTLHIVKRKTAPREPGARRAYIDRLRTQHQAGALTPKVATGEVHPDLYAAVLPHLVPKVIADA